MAKKAATKKTKVNKSAAIRELINLHPEKGPTEISKMLKDTQNIDAPPSMVSNIKGASSKKKSGGKKRGRPAKKKLGRPVGSGKAKSSSNGHGYLDSAIEFVEKVGSFVNAQAIMDKLKSLRERL